MFQFPAGSLDSPIAHTYRNGQVCHGELGLTEEDFKSHVFHIVEKHIGTAPSASAATRFIKDLHTNDLYLAIACAQRSEIAWDRFDATYRKYIKDLATFMTSTSNAFEMADNILVDLFLPNHSGQSRIGSYEGRSSLATWLRIVVSHRAINEHERSCNTIDAAESVLDIADESALHTVEASLRACRYEHMIDDSFRCSCKGLTDRERLMLLLRFDEELQLGEIARLFRVHQSTVTRQLERACKKLREVVITTLSTKYHLDQAAINECQDDIFENPSYSIISLIKGATASK